ncbi:MAG: glycosyltransferase family protein [Gemmatimonadaceae bacterium]|nr:glycosyltransferase family protein [Gemmatimonadaceae bacterium]
MPPNSLPRTAARPGPPSRRDRALAECKAGALALQMGKTEAGLKRYAAGVSLAPNDADIAALHGVALRSAARLVQAQRELIRAIALDASRADSFTQLAQTYRLAGDRAQAANAFLAAARLRGTDAIAWRDAAEALRLADRIDDGLTTAQHAASLAPSDPDIANTTALLLHRAGRLEEALALCERARAIAPDALHLSLTHAMLCRTLGRYELGWSLYERRLELPALLQRPFAPTSPRWDGSPLAGRSILVRAEQGLGDQIQFLRWASMLQARGAADVMVQAAPALVRLFRSAPGVDLVIASDRPAPSHWVHVDIGSLPHLLRTGDDLRADLVPYLSTTAADASSGRLQLAPRAAALRVGIVWGGSPLQEDNRFRSVPLPGLLAAILRPEVEVVVLQQGPAREQLDSIDPVLRGTLHDAAAACSDMYDTAVVASQCDLVISMCTSVVHLAGALALPTWLMLATPAEWRWGASGERSALYPSLRLFRQQQSGDWTSVLDAIRRAMTQLCEARHP